MKKILIINLLWMLQSAVYAQFVLENTFDPHEIVSDVAVTFKHFGKKKYGVNNVEGILNLYNLDQTIWRRIPVPKVKGYKMNIVAYISDDIFDLNSKIEYMAYYHCEAFPIVSPEQIQIVFNEDGVVLFENRAKGRPHTMYTSNMYIAADLEKDGKYHYKLIVNNMELTMDTLTAYKEWSFSDSLKVGNTTFRQDTKGWDYKQTTKVGDIYWQKLKYALVGVIDMPVYAATQPYIPPTQPTQPVVNQVDTIKKITIVYDTLYRHIAEVYSTQYKTVVVDTVYITHSRPAPPPPPTLKDMIEKLDIGKNLRLEDVCFHQSLAELLPEAYPTLDELAQTMLENPNIRILLEGHTSNEGVEKVNIVLSVQRVERVKAYLGESGVAADRIEHVGYGSKYPIIDHLTPEHRKKNRRVEVKLLQRR